MKSQNLFNSDSATFRRRSALAALVGLALLWMSPEVHAKAEDDLRRRCQVSQNARSCYELGFLHMHRKSDRSRKLAVALIKRGCALEKKQKTCSPEDAKLMARAFANRGRVTITADRKVIKMPKVAKSSGNTTTFASSASSMPGTYDNWQPQQAMPAYQEAQPIPAYSNPSMTVPESTLYNQGMMPPPVAAPDCAPNDPHCGAVP